MIADEAMADFDEQDDFEESEDYATEDDQVTPWAAVTDDGKTPEGTPAEVMKKIEDEVMEVAHGYDVRAFRKYCDGDMYDTIQPGEESKADTQRVRLINDSFESGENDISDTNTMGLQVSNNVAKKASAPFDMAQDSMTFSADQSTRF